LVNKGEYDRLSNLNSAAYPTTASS
jgi:hypothetical protein